MNVEKVLRRQEGVINAQVNFADSTAVVEYDTDVVGPQQLQQAVRDAGYDLLIEEDTGAEVVNSSDDAEAIAARQHSALKVKTLIASALSAVIVVFAMTPHLMHLRWVEWLTAILATPVVCICGRQFFVGAWRLARHRAMNMDTLVALSVGTAYTVSLFSLLAPQFWTSRGLPVNLWFETAAVIITFILVGRLLEDKAKRTTSSAIRHLIGLQPDRATVMRGDGQAVEVPLNELAIGDRILVRAGERIPVDGVITEGEAAINESMITGESLPAGKSAGDRVFAGTVNLDGSFQYRAEKVGRETMLAQIIRMVADAQNSRPPLQRLADRAVASFVPTVIAIACISALLWLWLDSSNPTVHALLTFVTVLIVACPCALGLATPTAVMVGVGRGASEGILFRDMDSLECLRKINALIIDKTGTLTEGAPAVTDAYGVNSFNDLLYSMERHSTHPLAKAVTAHLRHAKMLDGLAVETVAGAGLRATYNGTEYFVGNSRLFPAADAASTAWQNARQAEGKTVVLFGDSSRIYSLFAIADPIKPTAQQAVAQLKSCGVEVIMATGDNPQTAARIAAEAGIEQFVASMRPDDKLQLIRQKQQDGRSVAMVGDGINDSAALAAADVGIAMGGGSHIAIETAGLTIVSGDLRKIGDAICLSRHTVRTIRQNLFWAFIYNILALPVAAGVLYPVCGFLLDPMLAGAAMALSSVCVVSNSLRLRK